MHNPLVYIQQLEISLPNEVDKELLEMTFTHKSFSMDAPQEQIPHNERLEFLWDSILGMVVAHQLYERYPDAPESQLTVMKINLVKEPTLATVARKIGLWEQIRLGRWEAKSGWAEKDAVLSDTLEALIAYLYLDQGRTTVASFVETYIMSQLEEGESKHAKSYKSLLQELVQQLHKDIPVYEDIALHVEPTGNVLTYASKLYVQGKLIAQGEGASKKKAQEQAAMLWYQLLTTHS